MVEKSFSVAFSLARLAPRGSREAGQQSFSSSERQKAQTASAMTTHLQEALQGDDDINEEEGDGGRRTEPTERNGSVCAIEEDAMSCEPTLMAGVAENHFVEKTDDDDDDDGGADEDNGKRIMRRRSTEKVDTVEAREEEDNAVETVVGEAGAMQCDEEPTLLNNNLTTTATTVNKNDAEEEDGEGAGEAGAGAVPAVTSQEKEQEETVHTRPRRERKKPPLRSASHLTSAAPLDDHGAATNADTLHGTHKPRQLRHQQQQRQQQKPRATGNTKSARGTGERRLGPCDHCGVTESPQWRKGPPKKPMLCNACGTRYMRTRSLSGGNGARARQQEASSASTGAGAASKKRKHAATAAAAAAGASTERQRRHTAAKQTRATVADHLASDDDAAGFTSGTDEMESRRRRGSAGAADSLVGPSSAKRVRADGVFNEAASDADTTKAISTKQQKRQHQKQVSSAYMNALLMAVAMAFERDVNRAQDSMSMPPPPPPTAAVVPLASVETTIAVGPGPHDDTLAGAEHQSNDGDEKRHQQTTGAAAMVSSPPRAAHDDDNGDSDMTDDKPSHFALTEEIIRASNLRTERFRSRKPDSDRYIGVTCAVNLKGRTWQARIRGPGADGRERAYVHLGMHPSPEAAARAFDRAAIVVHGLHRAVLNFPICDYAGELDKLLNISLPELAFEYRCRPQSLGGGVYGSAPNFDHTRKTQSRNSPGSQPKRQVRDDDHDGDEHETHRVRDEETTLPMADGVASPNGPAATAPGMSKEEGQDQFVEAMQTDVNVRAAVGYIDMPGIVHPSPLATVFANTLPHFMLLNAE